MNMKTHIVIVSALVLTGGFVVSRIDAQQAVAQPRHIEHAEHTVIVPDDVQWRSGPSSLPAGAQYAVLEGDPAREGAFTMRLKLPAGYRIPPHTHPRVERVTVLEGEFKLGSGRRYDEQAMKRLPAGGFFTMPPGMAHFAGTDRETVVQLNGVGPWDINYINPADDPRQ